MCCGNDYSCGPQDRIGNLGFPLRVKDGVAFAGEKGDGCRNEKARRGRKGVFQPRRRRQRGRLVHDGVIRKLRGRPWRVQWQWTESEWLGQGKRPERGWRSWRGPVGEAKGVCKAREPESVVSVMTSV
eukprot:GFKZ01013487.1.p2 GENE.GFKZ01013487.1~~GFKZ01013487.1.p2  ORF type:complete len:128 (-),score=7.60 GFKZ01013487.1:173-556(-)